MNLALEFRPSCFGEIAGQPWVSLVLDNMVAAGEVPAALLFHGPAGSGKTSTARILAAALNCTADDRPCGTCDPCTAIRSGNSIDVIEVDAATNGRAEDIENLCKLLSYQVGSRNRVVILDEAHGVSGPGFDKLLKTLEEPPDNVTFILVTTEPEQIPETIADRCASFRYKRISVRHIIDRLAMIRDAKSLDVKDEVISCIADRAAGGLRNAIMLLDQAARANVHTLDDFYALTGESDFAPALLAIMISGRLGLLYDKVDEVLDETGDPQLVAARLVRCLRDVLVLRAEGTSVTAQGDALRVRQVLAKHLTEAQIIAMIRVMWDLQRLRHGNDPRMLLDLAVVMCAEQIAPARPSAASESNGHRKVTMADIDAMA